MRHVRFVLYLLWYIERISKNLLLCLCARCTLMSFKFYKITVFAASSGCLIPTSKQCLQCLGLPDTELKILMNASGFKNLRDKSHSY